MQNEQLLEWWGIYKNANVWENNMVPDHTPFAFTNQVNASFSAIYSQSGMMGTGKSDLTAYTKIFQPGVLWALEKLRTLSQNDIPPGMDLREVQRKRFEEYFAAIMYYIRTKWVANDPAKMLWSEVMREGRKLPKARYIYDLEQYGFNIREADFRPDATTKPAGAETDTSTKEPNPLVIDGYDKGRCEEMFQNFLRTSSGVKTRVSSKVGSTFDPDEYGW